jgi:hypothetical protein
MKSVRYIKVVTLKNKTLLRTVVALTAREREREGERGKECVCEREREETKSTDILVEVYGKCFYCLQLRS